MALPSFHLCSLSFGLHFPSKWYFLSFSKNGKDFPNWSKRWRKSCQSFAQMLLLLPFRFIDFKIPIITFSTWCCDLFLISCYRVSEGRSCWRIEYSICSILSKRWITQSTHSVHRKQGCRWTWYLQRTFYLFRIKVLTMLGSDVSTQSWWRTSVEKSSRQRVRKG